jgi:glycosyltransferase involved in cell wall biosynthesis
VVAVAPGDYTAAELDAAFQARPPQGAEVSPTILSVCRLVAKKRVDLIVRAYRALLDRHPSTAARLVIAGIGPEEASLRALADQLGLAGRIEFTGFLADAELGGLYRVASVFVSADNADYDLTVMTALAHGARTVVSVQYSLPEFLVSTRRLLVVAQPDADGFAEALHTALTASAPPPSLDGYAELSRMTWERYFDQVIEEIRAVAPLPPTAAEPAPRAADPAVQPRLVSA